MDCFILFFWGLHFGCVSTEVIHTLLYTAGWNVWGEWFLAGNQGNHQNFNPFLIQLWLFFIPNKEKKKKKIKKKIQNGRLKKTMFFKIANSQYFFVKILWIGPWVSRIDWCEGHGWGSTYMAVRLSDISSETGKKCIFCVFKAIFDFFFWFFFASFPWKQVKVSCISRMGRNFDDYPGF